MRERIRMSKDSLIYIGSPYTHEEASVMEERYQKVLKVTADLLREGFHVISPVVHCHPLALKFTLPPNFDFWKEYNLKILARCDILLVLNMEGYLYSKGLREECVFAKDNGIKIIQSYELPCKEIPIKLEVY